jgi:hypothetical protein
LWFFNGQLVALGFNWIPPRWVSPTRRNPPGQFRLLAQAFELSFANLMGNAEEAKLFQAAGKLVLQHQPEILARRICSN